MSVVNSIVGTFLQTYCNWKRRVSRMLHVHDAVGAVSLWESLSPIGFQNKPRIIFVCVSMFKHIVASNREFSGQHHSEDNIERSISTRH
jgi:hypothetical protein